MRERLVGVAIVVVLICAITGVAVHHPPPRRIAAVVTTTTSSTTAAAGSPTTAGTPQAKAIEALVTKLERFVEKHRGLAFKQPVKVTLLDSTTFSARIADQSKPDPTESAKESGILRALHLIPAGTDVGAAQQTLLTGAVLGLYDSKTKELIVRGDDTDSPEVQETLVHELTHALQDQWFDLERPDLAKKDDDSSLGFQTVFEGDAVRIQNEFVQSLSTADQRAIATAEAAQAGGAAPNVPQAILEELYFPYQVGPRFTAALVDKGGQARLDEAFRSPPTTTEQLLHPDRFLAGEPPKPVATPAADGPVIQQNVFGEFGFIQLFESAITSVTTILRAAEGWGGDEYVVWDAGAKTCVRDNVVMDSSSDTDELVSALHSWASKWGGITVTGRNPITITACG